MTSVPPAEARPPPPRPPDLLRSRTYSAFGLDTLSSRSPTDPSLSRPVEAQHADDRPLKRRKTDHGLGTEGNTIEQTQENADASRSQPRTRLIADLRLLSAVLAGDPEDEAQKQDTALPPLPIRPWRVARSATAEEPKPTHSTRAIWEVPSTPDTAEEVITAPPLGKRPAGYFPWTGRQAEDVLSEVNVKQGYFDRPPNPPDRELSTARVPLYNSFKHKSGIESLSTLFSLVLEAKKKHGQISSASSFKPPPRVTLAEARRKAWIADLADGDVPLRKLSRTIPQGIRGQSLLDQCIQNAVPLSRAIWFAKCVGANEIRTLKRKGTTTAAAVGSESKWLREWTVNVEQFIETILGQSGQPTWRANIQYALRLTTRLYLENLVDRDHYVDWIVKSFSASDNDRLPFWLIIVQVNKLDITRFRKRGKKLVEILVDKFMALKDLKTDIVQLMVGKLRNLIRGFAINQPECFIAPDSWSSTREGLQFCLNIDNPTESQILAGLSLANERCVGANPYTYLTKPDPVDTIVEILDSASPPYNPEILMAELLSACGNVDVLIMSCLDWATTKFRSGSARVYLVVRLLRKLHRQAYDVGSMLLHFITESHNSPGLYDVAALGHLVSELSRSHTFPTSKYLQWLNVRGLPRPNTCSSSVNVQGLITQSCSDTGGLMMHLSLVDVKLHLVNQRHALLTRAGFDTDAESIAIGRIHELLEQRLDASEDTSHIDLTELLSGWHWNVRSQISHWIRSYVNEKVKQRVSPEDKNPLQDEQPISARQFSILRSSLELTGDEAVLADVLRLCSSFNDEQLHASIVETITRHADAFSAIGALDPLRLRLCQIYMSLRTVKPTMPLLATALLDLCTTFPLTSMPTRLLQQDIVRGDRGRAVAAFSPFSDGLAESLQQAEATFIDDFEAILQSEPSMNEQTMNGLFTVLTERIGKQTHELDEQILFTYCQLMARLRLCRKQQGDGLIKLWLRKVLSKGTSSVVQSLIFGMIGTGALTIDSLVETIATAGNMKDTLPQMIPSEMTTTHDSGYSVLSKWEEFGKRKPAVMINQISELAASSHRLLDQRELCMSLVLEKKDAVLQLSGQGMQLLKVVLSDLLANGNGAELDMKDMFQSVSTTSFAFVQVGLRLLNQVSAPAEDDKVAESIMETVFDRSVSAPSGRHISMLLQGAGSEIAATARHLTEERIIEMLPKLPLGKSSEVDMFDLVEVQYAIDQAFEMCHGDSTPSAKSASQLTEKLVAASQVPGPYQPSSFAGEAFSHITYLCAYSTIWQYHWSTEPFFTHGHWPAPLNPINDDRLLPNFAPDSVPCPPLPTRV